MPGSTVECPCVELRDGFIGLEAKAEACAATFTETKVGISLFGFLCGSGEVACHVFTFFDWDPPHIGSWASFIGQSVSKDTIFAAELQHLVNRFLRATQEALQEDLRFWLLSVGKLDFFPPIRWVNDFFPKGLVDQTSGVALQSLPQITSHHDFRNSEAESCQSGSLSWNLRGSSFLRQAWLAGSSARGKHKIGEWKHGLSHRWANTPVWIHPLWSCLALKSKQNPFLQVLCSVARRCKSWTWSKVWHTQANPSGDCPASSFSLTLTKGTKAPLAHALSSRVHWLSFWPLGPCLERPLDWAGALFLCFWLKPCPFPLSRVWLGLFLTTSAHVVSLERCCETGLSPLAAAPFPLGSEFGSYLGLLFLRLLGSAAFVLAFLLLLPVLALVLLAVLLRSGVNKTSEPTQKRTWALAVPGQWSAQEIGEAFARMCQACFLVRVGPPVQHRLVLAVLMALSWEAGWCGRLSDASGL